MYLKVTVHVLQKGIKAPTAVKPGEPAQEIGKR